LKVFFVHQARDPSVQYGPHVRKFCRIKFHEHFSAIMEYFCSYIKTVTILLLTQNSN